MARFQPISEEKRVTDKIIIDLAYREISRLVRSTFGLGKLVISTPPRFFSKARLVSVSTIEMFLPFLRGVIARIVF